MAAASCDHPTRSSSADVELILRPGLYATRAKCHGYRDGTVDAVRAHLDPFDIADLDTSTVIAGLAGLQRVWWPQRDLIELAEFKYAVSLRAD